MSDLIITLVSLVVGIAATLIVGRYYFHRTFNKSLTPFLYFSTQLLQGVAPEVRKQLRVEYRGVLIDDVQELQFLIANTGERAIRDIIAPLTLTLPKDCSVLDASTVHVSPPGRHITLGTREHDVQFQFPLLNSREFFLVRLLVRGKLNPNNLSFSITADDLPPELPVARLSPDLITRPHERKFQWGLLVASIVFGFFSSALATVVYQAWNDAPRAGEGVWSFIPQWSWDAIAALVAFIPTVLIVVISVMMFFGAFSDFSFPPRRKFILPRDAYRYPIFFVEDDLPTREMEVKSKKSTE